MRTFTFVLIILLIPAFAGCGSRMMVDDSSPGNKPKQVEAGGVTVKTPEVTVGGFKVDPKEDRITGQ